MALAGARILWTAAVAATCCDRDVYGALDAAGVTTSRPDYGTSAIIAAWIGVIAFFLWRRGSPAAIGLCLVAALVGWFFRPHLDILDTEHAVAFAIGIGVAVWLPSLGLVQLRGFLRGTGFCFTRAFFGLGVLAGAAETGDAGVRVPNCCDQSAAPE